MFWCWLPLEVCFLGFSGLFALKGNWVAGLTSLVLGIYCQNNRIAEGIKARERMRHYGGHR